MMWFCDCWVQHSASKRSLTRRLLPTSFACRITLHPPVTMCQEMAPNASIASFAARRHVRRCDGGWCHSYDAQVKVLYRTLLLPQEDLDADFVTLPAAWMPWRVRIGGEDWGCGEVLFVSSVWTNGNGSL